MIISNLVDFDQNQIAGLPLWDEPDDPSLAFIGPASENFMAASFVF
jgi:hypothetical protein